MRRWLFTLAILLLLATPARAGEWNPDRLKPPDLLTYSWSNALDDSETPHLDAQSCGVVVASYEDDVNGSDTSAGATLYACPANDSSVSDCAAVATFSTDRSDVPIRGAPKYLFIDTTAATGSSAATARITLQCLQEYGGGGSAGGGGSFGISGTTGTEQTLNAIYDPLATFAPSRPLRTLYVSCDPVNDAGCDDYDQGGDDREKAEGTADSATATTLTDDALLAFADDDFNGMTIRIVSGTGVGQDVIITDFDGTVAGTVTVADWLSADPAAASGYVIFDQSLDGGDLPGGNDIYPGTPERPLATVPNLDNHMQCFTRFVFDSRDRWAGATSIGNGLAAIAPACPAGMEDEIGILVTVTNPGDAAIWDGSHQTARVGADVVTVSEVTATAWVALEHISLENFHEQGLQTLNNAQLAANWVATKNIRNTPAGTTNNHNVVSQQTSKLLCFNCSGSSQAAEDTQGTNIANLNASDMIYVTQGEMRRFMNDFQGQVIAPVDCSDLTMIGGYYTFVPGPANNDTQDGMDAVLDTDADCTALGDAQMDLEVARVFAEGPLVEGASAGLNLRGGAAAGMTMRARIFQSTFAGGTGFHTQDVDAANTSFLNIYMRGVLFHAEGPATSEIVDLATQDICDPARSIIDIANSAYDDEDTAGAWDLCLNNSNYADYETAAAASAANGIAAHWTNFFGDADVGDPTSVDLGGDAVDDTDTPTSVGRCATTSTCHQAMLEDYCLSMPFTVPAWALGGEGTMNQICLDAVGADIGAP